MSAFERRGNDLQGCLTVTAIRCRAKRKGPRIFQGLEYIYIITYDYVIINIFVYIYIYIYIYIIIYNCMYIYIYNHS